MISGVVTFQPKSSWQRRHCINRDSKSKCLNESVLEAVCRNRIGRLVRVRCCCNKECKRAAALLAGL